MNFTNADLTDANLTRVWSINTKFINATLTGTIFINPVLERADFTGSNLSSAYILDTHRWRNTTCSDGSKVAEGGCSASPAAARSAPNTVVAVHAMAAEFSDRRVNDMSM